MRRKVMLTAVLLGAAAIVVQAADPEPCDMKNVVKVFYCEECDLVIEKKDLASDRTYHECAECGETSDEAGKCDGCNKALTKKVSGKEVCWQCYVKPIAVDACSKTYYECEDCGHTQMTAGECADCEVKLQTMTSLALIEFSCPDCGISSMSAGKCSDEECDRFGKPLEKGCAMSGDFPHDGSK